VARVAVGTPHTPTEHPRDARPVCWRCGKHGNFQRNCRHKPREKKNQSSKARRRKPSPSPPSPPRFEDRLIAEGWIQEKPCRVTIDTGAFVTVAKPDNVV
jgi:hypothetical protein